MCGEICSTLDALPRVSGCQDPAGAAPHHHGTPSQWSAGRLGLRLCHKLLCHSVAWVLPPGSPPGNHGSQSSLFLASWLYRQPCLNTPVWDAVCHFLEESLLPLLQNGHPCDWSPTLLLASLWPWVRAPPAQATSADILSFLAQYNLVLLPKGSGP